MEEIFVYESLYGIKYNCLLQTRKYANGRIALLLIDANDLELVATITSNVPDVELQKDEVIVKSYSENEGMSEWMVKNNLATMTERGVASGYVVMPIMRLTDKAKSMLN